MFRSVIIIVSMTIFSISEARTAPFDIVKQVAMPDSCVGKTYCFEMSSGYPTEMIELILDKLDGQLAEGGNELGQRDGEEKAEDDCDRIIESKPIYQIMAADGTVRFVVQSKKKFQQIIRTESCKKPGRIEHSKFFPKYQLEEWNMTCSEKRIEFWFLVLSLDGEHLENVQIKGGLPVCCSCRLEFNSTES